MSDDRFELFILQAGEKKITEKVVTGKPFKQQEEGKRASSDRARN